MSARHPIIAVTGSLLNSTYDVIPPGLREGTLHSWNVAVQRQLPFQLTADIAYVGNRGVNLVMDIDTNASLVYGSGNVGRPQFAPFNRTGTTRTRSTPGSRLASARAALGSCTATALRTCWTRASSVAPSAASCATTASA